MRKRKFVAGFECRQLLECAAEKPLPLTITQRCQDNQWKVYKAVILKLFPYRMEITLPVDGNDNSTMQVIAGQEIAITFKKGYNKCLFTTRVISQDTFETDANQTIASMTVYLPEQIEKIQRRSFERTDLPDNLSVEVNYWLADSPANRLTGKLLNLSSGGIGVTVDDTHIPQWADDTLCLVQFVPLPGQEAIVAQARYRHCTHQDNDANSIGFQFIGLELTEEGRNIMRRISRVVTIYQRQNSLPRQTASRSSQ